MVLATWELEVEKQGVNGGCGFPLYASLVSLYSKINPLSACKAFLLEVKENKYKTKEIKKTKK